jgi:tetratricopeptide (TPR) repeat protein
MLYTNTGMAYGIRGNKGKALAYWHMGHTLLQIVNQPEAEVAQQKIDALRDMVNEETYSRLWQTSEGYVRWLSFQRHWITKETSVVKSKDDDLTKYSRNPEDETLHTLSDKLSFQAWLQGDITAQEGKWQEAQVYYQEALSIVCKQGRSKAQALLWGNLGYCYAAIKNFDEVITCFQKSLDLFHSLDDTRNELKTRLNLGTLLLQADLIAEARSH